MRHTARAFASTKHPVLVHIVPMRRCNLACTYCNEYDKTSDPVPIDVMLERIDKLAEFGSSVITISGGEPMMHPEIYDIIARIRHHGMIAGLISNGYYFQPEKVKKLNEAGLDYLQISIDNVTAEWRNQQITAGGTIGLTLSLPARRGVTASSLRSSRPSSGRPRAKSPAPFRRSRKSSTGEWSSPWRRVNRSRRASWRRRGPAAG